MSILPVKKILAPTDFSRASLTAYQAALDLASHFGAELDVLHVIEPVPALPADPDYGFDVGVLEQGLESDSEERLKRWVRSRPTGELAVRTILEHGDPARQIGRIAQRERSNLIIIATHGLTGWRHLVFGSVAEKVVRTAACPVLTVRVPDQED